MRATAVFGDGGRSVLGHERGRLPHDRGRAPVRRGRLPGRRPGRRSRTAGGALALGGRDRWKLFEVDRPVRAVTAQVDPERVLLLDVNYTNNSSRSRRKRRRGAQVVARLADLAAGSPAHLWLLHSDLITRHRRIPELRGRDGIRRVNGAPLLLLGVFASLTLLVALPLSLALRGMIEAHLGDSLSAEAPRGGHEPTTGGRSSRRRRRGSARRSCRRSSGSARCSTTSAGSSTTSRWRRRSPGRPRRGSSSGRS